MISAWYGIAPSFLFDSEATSAKSYSPLPAASSLALERVYPMNISHCSLLRLPGASFEAGEVEADDEEEEGH